MNQQTSATSETLIKGRDIADFSGKTIFVGIDVHLKDYQVAKVYNGVCLGNHRMKADSATVIHHLRSHYPGADFKCVYECCAWGFELQRQLTSAGIDCIIVHAADVASSDKEKRRKADKVDALKLARQLACGELKGIHVPEESLQKERNLIRYRGRLGGDVNRIKNRIKSLLKYQGIEVPGQYSKNNSSNNFMTWLEEQALKDPLLAETLLLMVKQLKMLRQLLLETEKRLRVLRNTKYAAQVKLATSLPGIGVGTAMYFLLEVGDVRRFRGFDALNDFIGFCPDTGSSGETDRDLGITTRRHKKLRSLLIEAAWTAVRIDPAMMNSYEALCKRMKPTYAIIRIARKLLRRLRSVMITGIEYQKGVVS